MEKQECLVASASEEEHAVVMDDVTAHEWGRIRAHLTHGLHAWHCGIKSHVTVTTTTSQRLGWHWAP